MKKLTMVKLKGWKDKTLNDPIAKGIKTNVKKRLFNSSAIICLNMKENLFQF